MGTLGKPWIGKFSHGLFTTLPPCGPNSCVKTNSWCGTASIACDGISLVEFVCRNGRDLREISRLLAEIKRLGSRVDVVVSGSMQNLKKIEEALGDL
jgi:hypothetical protein